MCTRTEFSSFVKGMKCIYTLPSFLPDRESIESWYVILQHFSYTDLKNSFASYCLVNKFPPTVADLIQPIIKPDNKTGVSAWAEVLQAVNGHGAGDGKKASDCLDEYTRKVVRGIGGMEVIRNCPTTNLGFLMKEFITAYDDGIQQETVNLLPDALRQNVIGYGGQYVLEDSLS